MAERMTDDDIGNARQLAHKNLMYCGRARYEREEQDLFLESGRTMTTLLREIDALRAELAEAEKGWREANQSLNSTERELEALEAELSLLREQNKALRESANYCASCGLLAPEHSEHCGRWELVVKALERERDGLRAAIRDAFNAPDMLAARFALEDALRSEKAP